MKINVLSKSIQPYLATALNIASKSTTDKIINCFLLEAKKEKEGNFLFVKATNYEISYFAKIPVIIELEGLICINASRFTRLIKEFSGNILIEKDMNNWVYVNSENSKNKLPGFESDLFPEINFELHGDNFHFQQKELSKAIDKTVFCVSEDNSKRRLNGLNLKIGNSVIEWISTDSFRASRYVFKQDGLDISSNVIIPKNSVLEIRKIFDEKEDLIKISIGPNVIQFETKNQIFRSQLIDDLFPDLTNLLNLKETSFLHVNRKEFILALRILNMFSENKNTSMKLNLYPNKIFLESEKLDFGESNNEINCEYEGQEIFMGYNIKFLMETINSFENSEVSEITLGFVGGNKSPTFVSARDMPEYKHLCMPVSLKW